MAQFKWIFLMFLVYQQNVKAEFTPPKRIINGFQAVPKQFPYQVLLNEQSDLGWVPFCGGVIVSKRIILTAGHCLEHDKDSIQICFGAVDRSNDREIGQQRLIIKQENIAVYSEYVSRPLINDIALIRLPADLQFDEYIQPAKLPDPNRFYENESGVVSGWGSTSNINTDPPHQLMYYNVTVLSNEECKKIVQKYHPAMFFTSSWICLKPSKSTPCFGDSGGPLAIRNDDGSSTLLGLTSFGMDTRVECMVNQPGIYTRVSSFLQWIKQFE